jgi:hypothetical protein
LDVPKDGFGTRPAVVLDPVDRLIYQAIVDAQSKGMSRSLSKTAYGWRLARRAPVAGEYMDGAIEWRFFRNTLNELSSLYRHALTTDITNFFASIPVQRLLDEIEGDIGRKEQLTALSAFLEAFDQQARRGGLPQRSTASAVLAHRYLRPLDSYLDRAGSSLFTMKAFRSQGQTNLRWMDDIWVFGRDRKLLRDLQVQTAELLRTLDLEVNSGKTEVLSDEDLEERAKSIEHSAVDEALSWDEPDADRLDAMLERLLENPEVASRTSVRFALSRVRKHRLFDHLDAIVEAAPMMPHVADDIAQTIRAAGQATERADWFDEYCAGVWGGYSWSQARMASMFDDKSAPSSTASLGRMTDWFSNETDLPRVAVAARKLAQWKKTDAKEIARERLMTAYSPAVRRIMAYTFVGLRGDRAALRSSLRGATHTDQIILDFMEDRSFKKLPLKSEF